MAERIRRTRYDKYGKRVLDVVLSFIALLLLSPLFLILALAVVLNDPGPVLFYQKRIGINRSEIRIRKFRTMKTSAPHDVPTHLLKDPEQYITGVGRFMRRHSLDELPQLLDILAGRMSLVGPRCALWNQDDLLRERDKYRANSIRPGLTGWAQIHGRDLLSVEEKAKYDGEYAAALLSSSRRGFSMDARCFFGTIGKVFRAEGVAEGGTGKKDGEGR